MQTDAATSAQIAYEEARKELALADHILHDLLNEQQVLLDRIATAQRDFYYALEKHGSAKDAVEREARK